MRRFSILLLRKCLTATIFGCSLFALIQPVAVAGKVVNDAMVTVPFRHQVWQSVLTQFVTQDGYVDLAKLRANPADLNHYLAQLAQVSPDKSTLSFQNQEERIAYWVNAHNAIALRLLVNHFPVKSLEEMPDFETVTTYRLGGEPHSLDMIRQKVAQYALLKPLLLFALTDFSEQSPAIMPVAYEGAHLKEQLALLKRNRVAQVVSVVTQPASFHRCGDLYISAGLLTYQEKLFQVEKSKLEDSAVEAGFIPVANPTNNWVSLLKPILPAKDYQALDTACSTPVEFFNRGKRLRLASP